MALCEDESCGLARVASDDRIVRAGAGHLQEGLALLREKAVTGGPHGPGSRGGWVSYLTYNRPNSSTYMLDCESTDIEVRCLTTRFASGLVFLAKPSPMFPRAVPCDIELPGTSSANDPHQPNETTPLGEY